ncbi:hypothetical protein BU23DRAFT_255560 [Bimuria novae-zelandiae CBS 107.79]|uniref:Secreted protein n=1 Tax=Bimuria novae-zelandiae CBS 107.79 TaxID=1447943 RepID=A0A6A5UVA4_9PLEO|nr:hypothetical protein BU23DRAFT_255560 [Bimuria novae-zelandiae CBS 107.79]
MFCIILVLFRHLGYPCVLLKPVYSYITHVPFPPSGPLGLSFLQFPPARSHANALSFTQLMCTLPDIRANNCNNAQSLSYHRGSLLFLETLPVLPAISD